MAKRRLLSFQDEISDRKARAPHDDWYYTLLLAQGRIRNLSALILKSPSPEIFRHAIVAGIAALETFHRATLVAVVDHGIEYRIRAAEMIDEKFSLKDSIQVLGSESVKPAELIAHAAPFNRISDLLGWLSHIFDCDFRTLLNNAVRPFDRHSEPDDPDLEHIVKDVDELIAELQKAFRLRHILAHEAADDIILNEDETRTLLNGLEQWTEAVEGILWSTVFKNEPLTQMEINIQSGSRVAEARSRLAKALFEARQHFLKIKKQSDLRSNHAAWKAVSRSWVDLMYARQGTMWRAFLAESLAEIYELRTKQLEGWNSVEEL